MNIDKELNDKQDLIEMDVAIIMERGVHTVNFVEYVLTNTLVKCVSQMNKRLIGPLEKNIFNSYMDFNTKIELFKSLHEEGWFSSIKKEDGIPTKMKALRKYRNLFAHSYVKTDEEFIRKYDRTFLNLLYLDVDGYKTIRVNLSEKRHDPKNNILSFDQINETLNTCSNAVTLAQKEIEGFYSKHSNPEEKL